MMFVSTCFGATHYANPSASGADNGTSETDAWETITKVIAHTYVAGDEILFKRGEVFDHEDKGIRFETAGELAGSSSGQITLGAYGSGAKPLFWGAPLTSDESWTVAATDADVFYHDSAVTPRNVFDASGDSLTYKKLDTDIATTALDVGEFTYDHRVNTTIISFADYSGTAAGTVLVTANSHRLVTGENAVITNTTNYNGTVSVTVVDGNTFYFTHSWDGNDAAGDVFEVTLPLRLWVHTAGSDDPDLASPNYRVTLRSAGLIASWSGVYLISPDYVTIQDLEFRGWYGHGVFMELDSDTTMNNCQAINVTANSNGHQLDNSTQFGSGVTITNKEAESADKILGAIISGCSASNNVFGGVSITGNTTGLNAYGSIIGNTVADNGWGKDLGGIYCHSSSVGISDNIVSGQEASPNEGVGIYLDQGMFNCVVERNIVFDNEGPGIQIGGGTGVNTYNNTVQNNLIYGNGKSGGASQIEGIRFSDTGNDNSAINNTLYDNQIGIGIYLDSETQTNVTIKNNIISESVIRDVVAVTLSGLDIDNNCVYNTVIGDSDIMSWDGTDRTWAEWLSSTTFDTNSINADPKFIDASNDNYHLGSNSPCLGIGRYNEEFPLGRNRYNRFGHRRLP